MCIRDSTWTSGNGNTYTAGGLYDHITTGANGCVDTLTLDLTINNGIHTVVPVTACRTYTWTSGNGNTYTSGGLYDHITTGANGCVDTYTLDHTTVSYTHLRAHETPE